MTQQSLVLTRTLDRGSTTRSARSASPLRPDGRSATFTVRGAPIINDMLLFLRPHDYFVNNYKELCTKLPGYSFVFFTSVDCEFCKDVEPAFFKLAETIEGCVFAIMSVDGPGRAIVEMAARTRTPFNYVPYLILYESGRPIAQFAHDEETPENNFAKMRAFLVDQTTGGEQAVASGVRRGGGGVPSLGGSRNAAYGQQQQYAIPAYTIGIPGNLAPTRTAIPPYSIGIPGNLAAPRRVCYIGGAD
jgi:hypothetical protein